MKLGNLTKTADGKWRVWTIGQWYILNLVFTSAYLVYGAATHQNFLPKSTVDQLNVLIDPLFLWAVDSTLGSVINKLHSKKELRDAVK